MNQTTTWPPARAPKTAALTSSHRDLLFENGVSAAAQSDARLISFETEQLPGGLPGGIAIAVPDRDRPVATIRLYPDPDPFAAEPIDLAQFDPSAAGGVDVDGRRTLLPIPLVVRSATGKPGPVLVATHDLWALAIASQTGLSVVSSCGDLLVEQAARVAAELANGEPVILLPYFGVPLQRAGVRRLTAAAGLFSPQVRIASWTGRSIAGRAPPQIATTHRARPGGLWGGTSLLAPGPATLSREGLGAVAAEIVGSLISSTIATVATRYWPVPPPRTPNEGGHADLFEAAEDIAELAAPHGAQAALLGGMAVDALVGHPVRPRKDVDLGLAGGPPDALERVTGDLVARGFEILYRRTRFQTVLCRGLVTVDLYRLNEGPAGTLCFASRTAWVAFSSADWLSDVRPGNAALRTIAPVLLYYMKLSKVSRSISTLHLASYWDGSRPDRVDLAAIRPFVDPAELALRISTGALQQARVSTFTLTPWPHWRSLVNRLAGRGPRTPPP